MRGALAIAAELAFSSGDALAALRADFEARGTPGVNGVIWSNLFESDDDINNWRFTNGPGWDPTPAPGSIGSFVRRDPTGGIMGLGCLELEQLTNGNMSSYWCRPFNPALTHYQGAGAGGDRGAGQAFYLQVRVKMNANGVARTNGEGRKCVWFSRSEASYTFQELVFQDLFTRGVYQMYQGIGPTGTQYWPLYEGAGGSDLNLQPGSEFAEPGGPGYCSYQALPGSKLDCWVPADEWQTYLFYINPATDQVANGTLTVWAMRPGMTDYVRIYHKPNLYMRYSGGLTAAFNALLLAIYETNSTGGAANIKQWFDQVILSTEWIAPPNDTARLVLDQGAPIALTGVLGISGDIDIVKRFNLQASAPIPMSGSLDIAGTITIVPDGASALEALAASMAPGTWAQITTATGQNTVVGSGGGNSGSHIHYGNSASWNSFARRIEMCGSDHGTAFTQMAVSAYRLDSNDFVFLFADNSGSGAGPGHAFDHNVINPYTGWSYQALYGNSLVFKVRQGNAGEAWSATLSAGWTFGNITWGTCWWSGSFTGAGAEGCLITYIGTGSGAGSATDGAVFAYDPVADSFFWSSGSMAPFSGTSGATYHQIAEYSAVHNCAIYGGGNATDGLTTKIWRLNSDRSYTPMPNMPNGLTIGILRSNVVCDPETGNFLFVANPPGSSQVPQLWELDPTGSGTWTQQTGSRTPPSAFHPAPVSGLDQSGLLSVALPLGSGMNVVAYISQTNSSDGQLWLYKHA